MEETPRRPNTYSFFVTPEQSGMLIQALDALEREYQHRTVTAELTEMYKDLRRRVVNCRDAIKRREKKEKS